MEGPIKPINEQGARGRGRGEEEKGEPESIGLIMRRENSILSERDLKREREREKERERGGGRD